MKYSDFFSLNPIKSVIKIDQADEQAKAKQLVSTFVITPSLGNAIEHVALPQLDFESGAEGKGIFVVGNYGTGKSHVMGFLSLVAEDASMLDELQNDAWRPQLERFAGRYKVKRGDVGASKMGFYEIVAFYLEELATSCGFDFSFKAQNEIPDVKREFRRFMQTFEQHAPDKGVLLVLDEVLEYLKGRRDEDLVTDLGVARKLGEFCDGSRFAIMLGVQKSLYEMPRFQFVADEVGHIRARYNEFRIDKKGVEQLIERYLFQKNEAQKQEIKKVLLQHKDLYEVIEDDLERFAALFPAHPRFIDEFQNVVVVERREILTLLSREGQTLLDHDFPSERLELITSDRYWRHIEADAGLNANQDVSQVKRNISTLKTRIQNEFGANEDKDAAIRLVEALGVNRLTTPSIKDPVGLTPENLKNNLLWWTKIPMRDATLLTQSAKRLLTKAREAANGQFLAVDEQSNQWYVDPTRVKDYDLEVRTYTKTISADSIQRSLNEIVALEMEQEKAEGVKEGRLWKYFLMWPDHNVERPGWLFFGFPNQRSTAQPPLDFYTFIIPSKRITGVQESFSPAGDEVYWFLEDYPAWKRDEEGATAETDPDSFLDYLAQYAAAVELGGGKTGSPYANIAGKLRQKVRDLFRENADDWITIQFKNQKKRLREWVAEFDPSKANSLFKTKVDAVSQVMFAPHFDTKYSGYPTFKTKIQEHTRGSAAKAALEIICKVGFGATGGTDQGKAVLGALELYDGQTPTPDKSPWLSKVRTRLDALDPNQFLNHSDLFETREGRDWMKGDVIEAEWLHVVLAAGAEAGDLVLVGEQNRRYDASNLNDLWKNVDSHKDVVRVGKPRELPLQEWRQLFGLFDGLNVGLLANEKTRDEAIKQFQEKTTEKVEALVHLEQRLKGALPFASEETQEKLKEEGAAIVAVKDELEKLQPLNTKARMQNLKLGTAEIASLKAQMETADAIQALVADLEAQQAELAALQRYKDILGPHDQHFYQQLDEFQSELKGVYEAPGQYQAKRDALKSQVQKTVKTALASYENLRKKHRLDNEGDKKKQQLLKSPELKQLNRLQLLKALEGSKSKLEEIHSALTGLVVYRACPDDDLLKSANSLCPHDPFDPNKLEDNQPADQVLDSCTDAVQALHKAWTEQLLKELQDPSVQASIESLKPEEKKLVEQFKNDKALPSQITDAFIQALDAALSGLKRRPIKTKDFARDVFGNGVPMKAEELRRSFDQWLKTQTANEDEATLRFVLED